MATKEQWYHVEQVGVTCWGFCTDATGVITKSAVSWLIGHVPANVRYYFIENKLKVYKI